MKGNATELWKYKIHRILFCAHRYITLRRYVRSPRGLADGTPRNAFGVWGKCSPIVAKNTTTPFFGCFTIISIHQSVWKLLYQRWGCDKA